MRLSRFLLASTALITSSEAAVIQTFHANNYINPANLQQTKVGEFMVGALLLNPQFTFTGAGNTGATGVAKSNVTDVFSFYSAAYRLNDKFVIGGDISLPYVALISYPEDSIAATDCTKTTVKDVDFSPKISYKATDELAFGAGLNFNNLYDFQANFLSYPDVPADGAAGLNVGNITNQAKGWSFGWNIGATYIFNTCNIFGLSYFSGLSPKLKGTSSGGTPDVGAAGGTAQYHGNFNVQGFNLPAVIKGTYTRIMSKNWILEGGASWSKWSSTKKIHFNNIVGWGNQTFPVNYKSTWSLYAFTRYQFHPDWAALGIVVYDQGAAKQVARLLQFPDGPMWLFKAGLNYQFNKETSFQVIGGYAYSKVAIYMPLNPISWSIGNLKFNCYSLDLRFVYKI